MAVAAPGATTYPTVDWGATGATLGVRLTRKTDAVDVVARTTVGVVESPAASELYVQAAGIVVPTTIGPLYMYVWDNTVDYVAEDLAVTSTGAAANPAPGETIYPSVNWGTPGETLGVSIRRKTDGVDVVARTTVGITEPFPGVYVAAGGVTVPTTSGALYEVVFDNTVDFTAEDLTVSSSSGADWCSLADVRDYLQLGTDTQWDSLLADMISDATDGLEDLSGRELADKGTLTREVSVDSNSALVDLRPWDLRSVTTLTVDPAGAVTVLTASQYQLMPVGKTTVDTYIQLLLGRSVNTYSAGRFELGTTEIQITGLWGAAATPRRAKRACIVTVGQWFRREVAARGSGRDDYDDSGYLTPLSIPGSAHRLLAGLTRTRIV